MLQLKQIPKDFIEQALERAKHYRLLNEPSQAESICNDILEIESNHQETIRVLILSITDQFDDYRATPSTKAKGLCTLLLNKYDECYYNGLIQERLAKTTLKRNSTRVEYIAYENYLNALEFYKKAEEFAPIGNFDSVLRWNSCVRTINKFTIKSKITPDKDKVELF